MPSVGDAPSSPPTPFSSPADPPLGKKTSTTTPSPATTVEPEPEGVIVAHALTDAVAARAEPDIASDAIATLNNPTERGGPLVFQALGMPIDGWLEVLLPVRPNGTTGWIPADQVQLSRNPYRIDVDLAAFSLTVSRDGEAIVTTPIGVGDTFTPTPLGDFYLVELLRPTDPNGAYGPFAYGLSGYSEVLDDFAGGDGVIGIHGTNRPDLLGQRVSHGCIRVDNAVIEELAAILPLGTPVSIVG